MTKTTKVLAELKDVGTTNLVLGLIIFIPSLIAGTFFAMADKSNPSSSWNAQASLLLFFIYFAIPFGLLFTIISIVRFSRLLSKYAKIPHNRHYAFGVIGIVLCLSAFPATYLPVCPWIILPLTIVIAIILTIKMYSGRTSGH